ncbi:ABC transporter ATP-binding protein [Stutzerimonas kirkiae]|uniref:Nitrate/sulfonate/bicarbonate ABC transporter ATP-binding protein n=1 Tax=Stutzerimonas kirkiae TaxID=2211392 RepID=A0A4Q9R1Z3_9GAMM|nr:ABC transporter ATP-binding protein [Stutzerimonas kirkiae]TBU93283.1 nitrate/sulfonate/bicarbonate ABC transporter ATP-binding protein [Stutzerimonas kirkiae]TBV01417.1 nitrate/sulfonate/bicarbonate ABC transporter ATP-binding protein [Stutzerimonas kirkiae]TBV06886.1 nitrate/sulfonate/bicarbonate ABC transporter ATP-binding protein [Stutzerimonas kirkiae]TBV10387.1 nitrate/sulfonate/bicarbonate ABC transporter ATP-binding protein [Stutzerimonas kirkiae]
MLNIAHVDKTYRNGTVALHNVSLAVNEGEIVAVVGGSGCGKSTLLRLISGLDQVSTGTITVEGVKVDQPSALVGLVFQEPRLLSWLTVAENIAFGIRHLPKAEREQRVRTLLEDVRLPEYGDRWPKELSGGQAQRVAIARALAAEPDVLLLDEPFSALDAFTRAELQDHLIYLWERHRRTFLIVTHDIEEAVTLADRVVVMKPHPGRIEAELPVDLPRPRDRNSPDFDAFERKVRLLLDNTITLRQVS